MIWCVLLFISVISVIFGFVVIVVTGIVTVIGIV